MPNHKIFDRARSDLLATAKALTDRRVAHMETGFPLSHAQMQAVILPRRWREILPEVAAAGVGVQSNRNIRVKCDGALMPRAAIVQTICVKDLIGSDWYRPMTLHLDALSDDESRGLAAWVNTAIHERRQAKFIVRIVTEFLKDHAPTTAHVQARWPELSVLFDHMAAFASGWGDRKVRQAEWKTKMQERPKSQKAYRWDDKSADWEVRSRRARELASGVLAGALILPEKIEEKSEVTASVQQWTPLPTDPDK